jgi:chloramphenicol-sensitive protein RarD
LLSAAAATIAINWGVYIYGVNSGQVVETSLGYFINPLVSVLFGVVLLHERLRPMQWTAVGLGAVAVVVLAVNYGGLPWIALVLAFAFGTYGLLKNKLSMRAVDSLAVETALLTPFAAGYLLVVAAHGDSAVQTNGLHMLGLLATTGLVTTAPLLLFSAAATRLPLSWVGLLQYTAPVLQFIIGVFIYDEQMPGSRWIGFALVWLALCLMTYDSVAAVRRGRAAGADLDIEAAAQEAH